VDLPAFLAFAPTLNFKVSLKSNMDLESLIREEYHDLLTTQTSMGFNGNETYTVIKFDLFLQRKFPNKNKFVNEEFYGELYQKMIDKYNNGIRSNNESFFKSFGILETISIESLKFYQPEVGINGPKYSKIDDPVYIIKSNDELILKNGYHRTLPRIVMGEKNIQGFVLSINN